MDWPTYTPTRNLTSIRVNLRLLDLRPSMTNLGCEVRVADSSSYGISLVPIGKSGILRGSPI